LLCCSKINIDDSTLREEDAAQTKMLTEHFMRNQLEIAKKDLDWRGDLSQQLAFIMNRREFAGCPTAPLTDMFFEMYSKQRDFAFASMEKGVDNSEMIRAMDQLTRFVEDLNKTLHLERDGSYNLDWIATEARAITRMRDLVAHQCHILTSKLRSWDVSKWLRTMERTKPTCSYQRSYEWSDGYNAWITRGSLQNGYPAELYCSGQTQVNDEEMCYYLMNHGLRDDHPRLHVSFNWEKVGEVWENSITKEISHAYRNPGFKDLTWELLSPHDWNAMIGSILLLAHDKYFVENFGREKITLDRLQADLNPWFPGPSDRWEACCDCEHTRNSPRDHLRSALSGKFTSGAFEPTNPVQYNLVVQIDVPKRLSDPTHWGHLSWKFCEFMSRRESKTQLPSVYPDH
jgi:hypothetical protein